MGHWNPLKCAGTALPVPLLLAAKLIALALLLTGHASLLPDPFLPFIPALDALPGTDVQWALRVVLVVSAVALLFNRAPRASCLILGGTLLFAVVSSKAYYGNNKTFCGLMLVMVGLFDRPASVWLPRLQLILVYFGAGLNKLLDADWRSGQFFDFWAGQRLRQPLYLFAAPLLPPLLLGKVMCWLTIVGELGLSAAFFAKRLWPFAIWVSLLFHASLLEFTGTTFVMFFYGMQSAVLVFVGWPRELVVIYDGDCGICNRIRLWLDRVDFDRQFQWAPLQSGIGDRWGIPREALVERLHLVADGGISSGFRACKLILLYNPAFFLLVDALIAAPPVDWVWYRRIVVAVLLAFFFPLFNPIGEWVYGWVARNRYRLSNEGACAVEPGASGPR